MCCSGIRAEGFGRLPLDGFGGSMIVDIKVFIMCHLNEEVVI